MNINQIFRQARKDRGLTQEQMAKEIGISRTYLSCIETNRRNLSVKTLEKLSKKFKVEFILDNGQWSYEEETE